MFSLLTKSIGALRIVGSTSAAPSQTVFSLQNTLSNFLRVTNYVIVPNCGFKQVGFVKRRCKDCYMVRKQNRLYNLCQAHPRHKQMQVQKKPKNTWILTHATQSKVRPW